MSTDYKPSNKCIKIDLGFYERMSEYGITKPDQPENTWDYFSITDGQNYVWVQVSEDGFLTLITRFGANDPSEIIEAIESEYECELINEHDDRFYDDEELDIEG